MMVSKDDFITRHDPHTPWERYPRPFVVMKVYDDGSYAVETSDDDEPYWGIISAAGEWIEFYGGYTPSEVLNGPSTRGEYR